MTATTAKAAVTILCIEDDPLQASLMKLLVARTLQAPIEFKLCETRDRAVRHATAGDNQIIFLDYCLGDTTGLDLLREIRSLGCDSTVIVVTAHGDAYISEEVTRAGADGYVAKEDLSPETLAATIKRSCANAHERARIGELSTQVGRLESLAANLSEQNAEILVRSRIDPLTGVLNRGSILEAAEHEHQRCERSGRPYALAMIDIDHFKAYNDTLGHAAGDECLRAVARAMRDSCRVTDLIGRFGGEEFLVLLPETDLREARVGADRLLGAVRAAALDHPGLGEGRSVSVSMGIAQGPLQSVRELLVRADASLYRAKDGGRDRWCDAAA